MYLLKKYRLTDMTYTLPDSSIVLHRIEALIDIPRHNVKAGDLGGWIESEKNLSQEGDCWVGCSARVFEDACVYGNAFVCAYAHVYGHAYVYDDAAVFGFAVVRDDAWVYGQAKVYGSAIIKGTSEIHGCVDIDGGEFCDYDCH